MSSGLYLKKFAKMLEISSFFGFFKVTQFFDHRVSWAKPSFIARYGKPSQAFWKAWQAEPSRAFFPNSSSQNQAEPSWALAQTQH